MPCLISLLVGLGVGALYALIGVRSPAPPIIALAGLLGMVMGEQAVPLARAHLWPRPEKAAQDSHNRTRPVSAVETSRPAARRTVADGSEP